MSLAAKARRGWLAATMAVCGGAVLLRLWLNLTGGRPEHSVAWRLVDTLSYFTITSNILAAVICAAALWRPKSRLAGPGMFASGSVYLLVTVVTYQLLLRGDPHGLSLAADTGVHVLGPLLFILAWLVLTPKRGVDWNDAAVWLIYPALYIAWTLGRGAVIHRYPYFFANVDRLGYPHALLNAVLFLAVFWLLGLGAVAVGKGGVFRGRARA